jgi:hypothetical protein
MRLPSRSLANVLLCLTAIAMPLQALWMVRCDCCSVESGSKNVAVPSVSESECCGHCSTPPSKPACCQKDRESVATCCSDTPSSGSHSRCQCGDDCRCVTERNAPNQPIPAPETDRGRSGIELTVSHACTSSAVLASGFNNAISYESSRTFFQPGTHICVLLCRFTL